MLAAVQMLFLALLAGSVVWLAYLARHQDAANRAELDEPRSQDRVRLDGIHRS